MMRPLFFSGGTALKQLAAEYAKLGRNPFYVITASDSGGSSRELRRVFHMPAIGDFRNRLLAIASPDKWPLRDLLAHRISSHIHGEEAKNGFLAFIRLQNWRQPGGFGEVYEDMQCLLENLPPDFDACNASIGNLAITGAWLRNGGDLRDAIARYQELLKARGAVIPIGAQDLHLAAQLMDGSMLHGQHIFKNISSPVARCWLTDIAPWQGGFPHPVIPAINPDVAAAIQKADLICYPMGSFFSSLLANFHSPQMGPMIKASKAGKIYVPNLARDPESTGLSLWDQIEWLLNMLASGQEDKTGLLDAVIVDESVNFGDDARIRHRRGRLEEMGIRILKAPVRDANGLHSAPALIELLDKLADL